MLPVTALSNVFLRDPVSLLHKLPAGRNRPAITEIEFIVLGALEE
jgi:hypothetical protein